MYLNAKKAASEASSGSLDNLFSSGANLLGKGMDFFSTAKTMQGILNLIVIAVIFLDYSEIIVESIPNSRKFYF